ncbi:hypothetical protein BX666DRAFT_344048 [Dichotomocladium elegans]|nr:hypothetical protein BX666DRAFT_344048 [Dichotomocladium elegans]
MGTLTLETRNIFVILSSLSGEEDTAAGNQQGRKTKRPILSSNSKGNTEINSSGISLESMKLPCKKIWMRNFIKQVTIPKELDVTADNTLPSHSDIKQESATPGVTHSPQESTIFLSKPENADNLSKKSASVDELTEGTKGGNDICDMDVDDGELSDASSASTIPLDHDPDYHICAEIHNVDSQPARTYDTKPTDISKEQSDEKEIAGGVTNELTKSESPPAIQSSTKEAVEIGGNKATTNASTVDKTQMPVENNPAPPEKNVAQSESVTQIVASQHEQTSASNNEQVRPAKVKLSLQEYLSRRAANQGSTKESLASTEVVTKGEMQLCNTDLCHYQVIFEVIPKY